MRRPARWFVRCSDCCGVMAVTEEPRHEWRCTCDGALVNMGRVSGAWLVRTAEECPCDDRCTSAKGPKCDCSCGGENHGTGMTVPVVHTIGGVPRLASPCPERAAEFRAALEAARAAVRARYGVRQGWEPESVYFGRQDAFRAINRAAALKSHTGRLRGLRAATLAVAP